MAQKHRTSNAQDIMNSDRATWRLYRELQRNTKEAVRRMANLRKAGLQETEFYREHVGQFRTGKSVTGRQNIAKELAKMNQFLNAKSSTVRGNIKARKNLVDLLTKNPKGPQYEGISMENIDRFAQFMKNWRERHMDEIPSSDKAVDVFLAKERLKLSEEELWDDIDRFLEFEEELENMSVEDLFPDGRVPAGQEFTLDDYLGRF